MKLASWCEKSFSRDTRRRGESYYRLGRVTLAGIDKSAIKADVVGSAHLPYRVLIGLESFDEGVLTGTCTCADYARGNLCKHLWATLLAYDHKQSEAAAEGESPADDFDDDADDLSSDFRDVDQSDLDDEDDVAYGLSGFDEWEDAWGGSRRRATSGRGGNGRGRSRRVSWREQLKDVLRAETEGSSGAVQRVWERVAGRRREIWYVLDLEGSAQFGRARVELFRCETKKNGEYGKPRPIRRPPDLLRSSTPEEDLYLLRLMDAIPSERPDNWWPRYGYYGSIQIAAERDAEVLPRLCKTGRFRCRRRDADPVETARPIAWDDGLAYRFGLEMLPDDGGKRWLLGGMFFRGDKRISLDKPDLVLNSGVILINGRMAALDAAGVFPWIMLMRRHGEIAIPYDDRWEFLKRLYASETIPQIDLPQSLRFPEIECEPQPILRVHKPDDRRPSHELCTDLLFVYDGTAVSVADCSHRIVCEESQRIVVRDAKRESEFLARLASWSVRPCSGAYSSPKGDLAISARQLDEIVVALSREGWIVEAEGLRIRRPGTFHGSVTSGVDWFDLDGQFDYGDGIFTTLPELLRAVQEGQCYVQLSDGSRGMLPEKWLAKFGALAELGAVEGEGLRFSNSQAALLDALLAAQENVSVDRTFADLRDKLRSFTGIQPQEEPRGFSGSLRGYQREGLGWLQFLESFRLGGCLADDMGLGKTVQILALLEGRRSAGQSAGPSLIVVPRSLVFNWIDEAARFTPQITVRNYTGPFRGEHLDLLQPGEVLVTTYGTLRRDILKLKALAFDYAILDESQAIKNAGSLAAKAARLVNARHRLALTGTPIENHLGELWSMFEFLNPGMLGRSTVFQRCWKNGRPDAEKIDLLRAALAPFLLRRTKEKVLTELPEKTEQTLYCELDRQERKAYDQLRKYYRDALQKKIDAGCLNQSKIQVLEALLRLRQAACHRGLLDQKHAAGSSAKLETLLEQLTEILAEGHKALVFSQFTSLLAIVREHLDRRGIVYEYLDGGTIHRGEKVRRFQEDPDCPLFLISLKAGGHGLNLTAADYVFILDPWWNPAVEAQAVDRVHRIGQERPVFAYRIIARDTVEEKILQLQASKRNLAEAIISADGSLIQRLTAEDLQLLLS